MNGDDRLKTKARRDLRFFADCLISSLIDSGFLAFWVLIQWAVGWLVARLELSGIDQVSLVVFQIIFFISTLAPIVIYVCTDIWIMIQQAVDRIRKEGNQHTGKAQGNAQAELVQDGAENGRD